MYNVWWKGGDKNMKIELSEAFVTPNIGEIFSESTQSLIKGLSSVIEDNFSYLESLNQLAINLVEPLNLQFDRMIELQEISLGLSLMSENLVLSNIEVMEHLKSITLSFSEAISLSISDYTFRDILDIEADTSNQVHVEESKPLEDLLNESSKNFELSWQEIYQYMLMFSKAHPIIAYIIMSNIDDKIPEVTETIFFWMWRHFIELLTFILSLIGS